MPKKFNERKILILLYAKKVGRTIRPVDIQFNQEVTIHNACQRLSKMHLQGYFNRLSRGHYSLSAKGRRILLRLKERRDTAKAKGVEYSLNLRKMPKDNMVGYT